MVLGLLWNLAGVLYGRLSGQFPLGFVSIVVGAFYFWRAKRLRGAT